MSCPVAAHTFNTHSSLAFLPPHQPCPCCPLPQLAAKADRLKRAELRAEVLGVAREERRRSLVRQSANWVTPQTLEARIQEALNNPVALHAE